MLQCNLGIVFLRYCKLGSTIKINHMITVTNELMNHMIEHLGELVNAIMQLTLIEKFLVRHLRNCTVVLLKIKYTSTIHNLK